MKIFILLCIVAVATAAKIDIHASRPNKKPHKDVKDDAAIVAKVCN